LDAVCRQHDIDYAKASGDINTLNQSDDRFFKELFLSADHPIRGTLYGSVVKYGNRAARFFNSKMQVMAGVPYTPVPTVYNPKVGGVDAPTSLDDVSLRGTPRTIYKSEPDRNEQAYSSVKQQLRNKILPTITENDYPDIEYRTAPQLYVPKLDLNNPRLVYQNKNEVSYPVNWRWHIPKNRYKKKKRVFIAF
jgi:hypothetical protein